MTSFDDAFFTEENLKTSPKFVDGDKKLYVSKPKEQVIDDLGLDKIPEYKVYEVKDSSKEDYAISILFDHTPDRDNKNPLTVVSIAAHPRGDDTKTADEDMKTRSLGQTRQTELKKTIRTLKNSHKFSHGFVDRFVQLDLFIDRTKGISEAIDAATNSSKNTELIKYWVNQADIILLAWGAGVEEFLLNNPELRDYRQKILKEIENKQNDSKSPAHIFAFGFTEKGNIVHPIKDNSLTELVACKVENGTIQPA